MTLEKAIETLELHQEPTEWDLYDGDVDAIKLSIEASKAYAEARRLGLPLRCELLPGETED